MQTVEEIAVDSAGNAYVTGTTNSLDFSRHHQTPARKLNGGGHLQEDTFLVKLDPAGANLLYSTFIGGSGDDNAYALTLLSSGDLALISLVVQSRPIFRFS